MSALITNNLTKIYKEGNGVIDINIEVGEGESVALVGSKNSGKTTILRTIVNIVRQTSGDVSVFGFDSIKKSAYIKEITGYMPSDIIYYKWISASSIINNVIAMQPKAEKNQVLELCDYLSVDISKKLSTMTLQERKKLLFIQSLIGKPKLLLLDEPFAGLDDDSISKMQEVLTTQIDDGLTLFCATENIQLANSLCNRNIYINGGTVVSKNAVNAYNEIKAHRISVKTKDSLENAFSLLKAENIIKENGYVSFYTESNIDSVIKAMSFFTIDDIKITVPLINDVVVHLEKKQLEIEEEV